LRSGQLSEQDYYRQILRLVYRLIFLFVAEDRDLLFHPEANEEARKRYSKHYSTTRLRQLVLRRRGTRHVDRYRGQRLIIEKLGDDNGCLDLGLPALGSFLFATGEESATPDLDGCELSNSYLFDAIRELAHTAESGKLRPVDYRNMGGEERGGVYESLLEMHPVLNLDAGTFQLRTASGNERKTTGTYYTPFSLVTVLLDSALDPVLEEAAQKPDPQAAILALKVCDPACGSGQFLIGAAHRIAKRLANVRPGDAEPSPEAIRKALRDVIGHCIYGVDINPMAVEIAQLNLWLEALDPGKPLSFLAHHIKVGNSLLGTTPALMQQGIPDEAFEPIQGDDRAVCLEYKKRNREERKGQQSYLYNLQPWEQLGNLAASMMSLGGIEDNTIDGVHRREERYKQTVNSTEYTYNQQLADAWCAAFVWRKTKEFAYPITEQVYRRMERNPSDVSGWMEEICRLAAQYKFFHWHLEFPEVFQVTRPDEQPTNEQAGWVGGFDVVLGNVPWERIKLQEQEWFAARRPDIAGAPNAAARKRMIEALKTQDPSLHSAFMEGLREAEGESHLIRRSGRFPLTGRGDVNTYAVFAETNRLLVNATGRVGMIAPSGIATDDTTKFFFQDLVDTSSLISLYDFENRNAIFPGVHRSYKFCLLTMTSRSQASKKEAEFVFFALGTEQLKDEERRFTLTREEITLLNPNTRTCPIFRSKRDAELTKTIYRSVPILLKAGTTAQSPWGINFSGTFHMAGESAIFRTMEELQAGGWVQQGNRFVRGHEIYLPLYESKLIHHFDHRWATYEGIETRDIRASEKSNPSVLAMPRYWVPSSSVSAHLEGKWNREWLLGWRRITGNVNERTFVCAIMPRVGYADSGVLGLTGSSTQLLTPLLLACLSSFVLDYVARQKLGGNNMLHFIVQQLPVLPPETYYEYAPWQPNQTLRDWILPRVLELTYTAWDLEPFARDCGYSGPPFRWDEERRFLLRCELDAAYFHLYGISREDTDYIMNTFPIVRRKDEALHGEYRTKRVILEIYGAMQRAIKTSESYRTLLDPPPADPRAAHPTRDGSPAPTYVPPSTEVPTVEPLATVAVATQGAAESQVQIRPTPTPTPATSARQAAQPKQVTQPAELAKPVAQPTPATQQAAPAPRPATPTSSKPTQTASNPTRPQQTSFLDGPLTPIYKVGERVEHPTFGQDQVVGIQPSGQDYMVTVAFKGVGTKKLMASMAKLERI
jgi:hypothetical protein